MRQRQSRRFQHGVTLIEILIVLAIIATLTALVMPHFHQYQQTQARKAAIERLVQLQAWVEMQVITKAYYPSIFHSTLLEKGLICSDCQVSSDYQFSIEGSDTGYRIIAHPQVDGRQHDDPCNRLVLYPNGVITSVSAETSCSLPSQQKTPGFSLK
ncbi:type IV pilin protein [Salinivibrio sharmensis]|uniref:Prepilin-type N-terminal cleavage/methylation domain-containing protein n=1 Tax=Salinivibrio sharmensis TaxID=390883 RepID=A0ABX3K8F8_9GAMM|nr:type IV pilin protein [Salinivibrio sharmensis]OOE84632.1 hypothetical protein BZG74_14855 [Salinivibrio sharmensis]